MAFVISEWMPTQSLPLKGNKLIQNVLPALNRYCLSLTGSVWEAEDLVQTTLMHMLQSGKDLLEVENEEAYLIRSARNRWIDHIRRQNAQKRLSTFGEQEFSWQH